jgi:hypothetical protein
MMPAGDITAPQQAETLMLSQAGRFSIQIFSPEAAGNRGAQGRYDVLGFRRPADRHQRFVMTWSSSLGQSYGRLEWFETDSRHRIFSERNELFDEAAELRFLQQVFGFDMRAIDRPSLVRHLMTPFIQPAGRDKAIQEVRFQYADQEILLRIIPDRNEAKPD